MTTGPVEWPRRADELAAEAVAAGEPTAWFERLYAEGVSGSTTLAWDRSTPSALLVQWAEHSRASGSGRTALVVGAGLGADAAYLAGLGFDTTAFDVSPTAVALASERVPGATFVVADLLALPADWRHAFDLVVEIYTVQALPRLLRAQATTAVGRLVAQGGTLVVIQAELGPDDDPADGPPWSLTRDEMEAFAGGGLTLASLDENTGTGGPSGSHWLAEFVRPVIG